MDVLADRGEQFEVDIGLLIALGFGDSVFVDLPQQHLGKAI